MYLRREVAGSEMFSWAPEKVGGGRPIKTLQQGILSKESSGSEAEL